MSLIFISYRRDDSAPYAGRLYDRLTAHFGKGQVFMDIDQIGPGEDCVEVIDRKVGACDIAVVLIGKSWLSASDAEGKRRLDDPEDFVRLEVATALERNIRVLPVLVGGAKMPRMQQLPESLAVLSRRNAFEISDSRFHDDVNKLIQSLESAANTEVAPSGASANVWRTAWPTKRVAIAGVGALVAAGAVIVMTAQRGSASARGSSDAPVAATTGEPAPLAGNPAASDVADQHTVFGLGGVPAGFAEQLQETKRRANGGSADAQYSLAVQYECGQDKDLALAAQWYESSAKQGHVAARAALTALQKPLPTDAREREFATIRRELDCNSRMQDEVTKSLDEMNDKAGDAIKHIKPG